MATITDTVQIVPTYNETNWDQTTTLDGSTFQLKFHYNQRENCYYLSVYDLEGSPVYLGVKLICRSMLLRKCADAGRAPAGDFWVEPLNGDLTPPGLGDLAPDTGRCVLSYIPVALIP